MKAREIIQIIIFILIGLAFMFGLQPYLFDQRILFGVVRSVTYSEWIEQYTLAAAIIFGISVIFTIIWCVLLLKNQDGSYSTWKAVWYVGLFVLTLIVIGTVYINNQDDNGELIRETFMPMTLWLLFDSLFLLYWLPTVTSTPGLLKKKAVPGAILINDLIGRN